MTAIESLARFEVDVGEHRLASHHNGHSKHKQELGANKHNNQEQHQGSRRSKLLHDRHSCHSHHSNHSSASTTKVRELAIKLRWRSKDRNEKQ